MSDEEIELEYKMMHMLENPPKSLFQPDEVQILEPNMMEAEQMPEPEQIDTSALNELDKFLDNLD